MCPSPLWKSCNKKKREATPGLVILGLMGSGFFMATIFPTSFAFGSQYTYSEET